MSIDQFYLLDEEIILMTGEYDHFGRFCARVMIGGQTILVSRSPLQLIDDTLNYIGFDLKGANKGTKNILGNINMWPIIVNPYKGICLFPYKSPRQEDCVWFNPDHIVKTKSHGFKTEVELSNGVSIIIDLKKYTFITKIQTALQLKNISRERGTHPHPLSHFITSEKQIKPIAKLKEGKYDFKSLMEYNG
ncbi:competence protein ComK [Neobacillus cucumis]|uniref:competence protein ComK n=1 Tax=Neobacillus cucumis TaxID=1740721 RepID=UPI002E220ED0|nr:competence protein ComK [Neobacillus cucumis]MED4227915.1 competence protein ComK [Neobacillus cucumis]